MKATEDWVLAMQLIILNKNLIIPQESYTVALSSDI